MPQWKRLGRIRNCPECTSLRRWSSFLSVAPPRAQLSYRPNWKRIHRSTNWNYWSGYILFFANCYWKGFKFVFIFFVTVKAYWNDSFGNVYFKLSVVFPLLILKNIIETKELEEYVHNISFSSKKQITTSNFYLTIFVFIMLNINIFGEIYF